MLPRSAKRVVRGAAGGTSEPRAGPPMAQQRRCGERSGAYVMTFTAAERRRRRPKRRSTPDALQSAGGARACACASVAGPRVAPGIRASSSLPPQGWRYPRLGSMKPRAALRQRRAPTLGPVRLPPFPHKPSAWLAVPSFRFAVVSFVLSSIHSACFLSRLSTKIVIFERDDNWLYASKVARHYY